MRSPVFASPLFLLAGMLLLSSLQQPSLVLVVAAGGEEEEQQGCQEEEQSENDNNKASYTTINDNRRKQQRARNKRRGLLKKLKKSSSSGGEDDGGGKGGKGGKKVDNLPDLKKLILENCMSLDVCCDSLNATESSGGGGTVSTLLVWFNDVMLGSLSSSSSFLTQNNPSVDICRNELGGEIVEVFGPGPSFIGNVYCCDADIDVKELADDDSSCFLPLPVPASPPRQHKKEEEPTLQAWTSKILGTNDDKTNTNQEPIPSHSIPVSAPTPNIEGGISIGGRFVPGANEEAFCLFYEEEA